MDYVKCVLSSSFFSGNTIRRRQPSTEDGSEPGRLLHSV